MHKMLSVCIPTYGRVDILKKTLESFYSTDVKEDVYEICISDNSPTDETKEMLERCFSDKQNIIYRKSKCEGYYNSIEALKLGTGTYLKLHNNYTKVNDKFGLFLNNLERFKDVDSVIFFTFGSKKIEEQMWKCDTFDDFMYCINYLSTWSTSFGLWKSDFDRLMQKNLSLDKMFPHTSLLFHLTDKRKYVVDDTEYFENQDVGKKGGYNLPDTFGTRYLGMCKTLLEDRKISEKTFEKIRIEIFNFISDWYFKVKFFPEKYYFEFDNWEKTIENLYNHKSIGLLKRNYLRKYLKNCFVGKLFHKAVKIFGT